MSWRKICKSAKWLLEFKKTMNPSQEEAESFEGFSFASKQQDWTTSPFFCYSFNRLPKDNVSCFVSFPSFNQGKISSDGFFHDVVSAIELPHLCTS